MLVVPSLGDPEEEPQGRLRALVRFENRRNVVGFELGGAHSSLKLRALLPLWVPQDVADSGDQVGERRGWAYLV